MAELALGAIGVALAWRGIVDLCSLLTDILQDDDDERGNLRLRAELATDSFKEWGEKYGVDQMDGEFASLAPKKQMLVQDLLSRQLKSSTAVFKIFEKYEPVLIQKAKDLGPFHQAIQRCRTTVRQSKGKVVWKANHRKVVTTFVEDLELRDQWLWRITRCRMPVISNNKAQDSGEYMAEITKELRELRLFLTTRQDDDRESIGSCETLDAAINASVQAVAPDALWKRVDAYAIRAASTQIDSRIGEELTQWWWDDDSSFLCIETPVDLGDEISAMVGAAFYTCASQPKLIYVHDGETSTSPIQCFAGMVNALIQQAVHHLVTLQSSNLVPKVHQDINIHGIDGADLVAMMEVLKGLILQLSTFGDFVVLVIEGIELLASDMRSSHACGQFLDMLRSVKVDRKEEKGLLKAFFIGPGRGDLFSSEHADFTFLDALDTPLQTSNLLDHLRFAL